MHGLGTIARLIMVSVLAAAALAAAAQTPPAQPPVADIDSPVDPAAVAALDRMGSSLRALDRFGFRARTTTDYVLNDGQKVALEGTVDYQVDQPNRFYVEVKSQKQQQQYLYDGTDLVIYSPRLKYYSVVPVKKSNQDLLVEAMDKYGIEFPLADLFLWGTQAFKQSTPTSAVSIGPAFIAGQNTDHYAFRQPGADWQVWISSKTHLPLKLVIVSLDDASMPTYVADLDWKESDRVPSHDFAFKPPAGVHRIPFEPAVAAGASYRPEN